MESQFEASGCVHHVPWLLAVSHDCHVAKVHIMSCSLSRYELYLPLHELWKKYMEDLLQIGR